MEDQHYNGTDKQRREYPPIISPNPPTLTLEQLLAISQHIKKSRAEVFLPWLNKFIPEYNLNDNPRRLAAFLAQILHESGYFRYTTELWGPTAQQRRYERDFKQKWSSSNAANSVAYALGNENAGDGSFFRGHGLIQITGRGNHRAASIEIFGDTRLLKHPDLLATPEYATQSACWYFEWKGLYDELDSPGIVDETKKVNGGTNGLADRQKLFDSALSVLT